MGGVCSVCKSVYRSSTFCRDKMILLSLVSKLVFDSGRHSLQKNNSVLLWYHSKLLPPTKHVALFVKLSEHRKFQQTANTIWRKVFIMQNTNIGISIVIYNKYNRIEILLFITGMRNLLATAAIVNIITIYTALYCNIYSKTIIFTASLTKCTRLSKMCHMKNVQREKYKANVQH